MSALGVLLDTGHRNAVIQDPEPNPGDSRGERARSLRLVCRREKVGLWPADVTGELPQDRAGVGQWVASLLPRPQGPCSA